MRLISEQIGKLKGMDLQEMERVAREIEAPIELVVETAQRQRLPVVNFAAGGVATPADAALMMKLGVDGVFVGSGIFKSEKPAEMASAIVEAVNNFDNPDELAKISKGLGSQITTHFAFFNV
jgi:pyridoxal 5'-phosphate synthase pdxS subunit